MHTVRKLIQSLVTLAKWGILAAVLVALYLTATTLEFGSGRDDHPPEAQTPLFDERGPVR